MPTWNVLPYETWFLHEDGKLYSLLKCPYEGESEQVLVYPNGFMIPSRMIWGE